MRNETTNTAVPKLRFPEFEEAGNWEIKEVGQVFRVTRGNVLAMGNVEDNESVDAPYPVYSSQTKNSGLAGFYTSYLFENAITWTTDGANAGDVNYRTGKFYCTNVCGVLISEDGYANPCIAALINSVSKKYVSYVGNPKLMNGVMGEIKIPFPLLAEQQKIAATLSSFDDLLTAHSAKLAALQAHKRGLMQGLFPAEGETVPKLRFPEFREAEEWEEVVLEKISHKIMVGIASAATHAYRKSGIILFRNQNIKEGYLDDNDILFIDEAYEKAHKNKRLKAGDLLIARTGYPGTAGVVPNKYEGSQSFTTLIVRPNHKLIYSDFLCFYINSEKGKAFFESTKIGGGQQNVNAGALSEMPIPCPSLSEQQKIADCLTSLDNRITAQTQQIKALKLHKKGLMQGLFPAAAEPTA